MAGKWDAGKLRSEERRVSKSRRRVRLERGGKKRVERSDRLFPEHEKDLPSITRTRGCAGG